MPAWMNALTMVSPDLRIDTGPPIAFGSAARTASANLRKLSLSLGSPFGNASTRISPSFDLQLLTNSGGSVFKVTGPACSVFLSWSNTIFIGAMKISCALSRVAWSRSASFASASASRRDATEPGPLPSPAALRKLATVPFSASTFSASVGAASTWSGFSAGPTTLAACAISFSFAGWSSGTKLSSDITRRTSGTFSSRASIFFASASELVSTLMALAPVLGSLRRSRKVAIDSAFGLRRLIGLKSNLRK